MLRSDLRNVIDILARPQWAIDYLRSTPSPLIPMFLVPLASTGWLLVHLLTYLNPMMETRLEAFASPDETGLFMTLLPILEWYVVVADLLFFYAGMLILAGYLCLITIRGENTSVGYREWFSLVVWAQVPYVIFSIVGIALLLFHTSGPLESIVPAELNPFSPGAYLNAGSFTFLVAFLRQVDLFAIWTLGILAVGYSQWSKRSIWLSVTLVSIPYIACWAMSAACRAQVLSLLPEPYRGMASLAFGLN